MDSKKPKSDASFDAVFPTREQFLESCKPQAFSLLVPIMKYIWSNPSSPEVYRKLIKSCKFFFLKNPILVINNLFFVNNCGLKFCNEDKCDDGFRHEHQKLNIDLFHGKIWLNKRFSCYFGGNRTIASRVISKLYQSDIKLLKIRDQILTYDELKFIAASVEVCLLGVNIVKYDDGKEVPCDEIIKLFFGANIVILLFDFVPRKNYANFINACATVKKVLLRFVPVNFDVHEFYIQMKRNKSRALITIHSWNNLNHFNDIVEEILATDDFDFIPPVILYGGLKDAKIKKMKEIQKSEAAKYR